VLPGIAPHRSETEYGWIEPDAPLPGLARRSETVSTVSGFWEKRPLDVARRLQSRLGRWNAFVVVGRVPSLLALIREGPADPRCHVCRGERGAEDNRGGTAPSTGGPGGLRRSASGARCECPSPVAWPCARRAA